MEDAATAEISRSQLWQWRMTGTPLDDGQPLTADRYRAIRDDELAALGGAADRAARLEAAELLDGLVLDDAFHGVPDAARLRSPRMTVRNAARPAP